MDYCTKKNIIITAYSAFGNNTVGTPLLITHPDVKATAERLTAAKGKTVTPAHVLLAWAQVGGHTVIPKSVTLTRIHENFQEIDLDDEAIQAINKIGDEPHRFNVPFTCTYPVVSTATLSSFTNTSSIADAPSWNVNIFNDEKEQTATTNVVV